MLYLLLHEKDIVLISFGNGLLQEQETKKKTQQPAVFSFSESRKSRCNLWSKERRVASLQEAIVSKAAHQREAAEDLSGRLRALWTALEKEAMKKLHLHVHAYLISVRTVLLTPKNRSCGDCVEGVQHSTIPLCVCARNSSFLSPRLSSLLLNSLVLHQASLGLQ